MKKNLNPRNLSYWKTGTSSPGTWMDKTEALIENHGGIVHGKGDGKAPDGRVVIMFSFELEGEQFQIVWPVLAVVNPKDRLAAKRQAATAVYHDVKAKCNHLVFKGARVAFLEYLLLPDGRRVADLFDDEILQIPTFTGGG